MRRSRPYLFYDAAVAVCSECLVRCEAKVVIEDGRVFLDKWCRQHGKERVLVADDPSYWRRAREQFLKPAEMPERFQTGMKWGCPYDCGLCPDHQQHSCLVVLEINEACNLRCPVCYAESGPEKLGHRSLATVEAMLDAVVRAEGKPDVVQISGGEPTIHPELFAILDAAKRRPIRHVMLNTNGIRLAKDPDLAKRLADYQPGFEVYLQFDSLRDSVHERLRGARLASVRRQALEHLEAANVSTTLVCTLEKGVNDDEIGEILEHALTWRCVRGVTLQPVQEAGRTEGYDAAVNRLTLTEVRRRIVEQSKVFEASDIVPVPCHPDALAMGYALKLDGQVVPLTRYARDADLLAGPENTIVLEDVPVLKEAVGNLFSTGIGPEDQATRLSELLCCLPTVDVPGLGYENVFRVLIVRFMDARDLDMRAVKRSCIQFVEPDGRMIPFDTYNVFYRGEARRKRLEEIRATLG